MSSPGLLVSVSVKEDFQLPSRDSSRRRTVRLRARTSSGAGSGAQGLPRRLLTISVAFGVFAAGVVLAGRAFLVSNAPQSISAESGSVRIELSLADLPSAEIVAGGASDSATLTSHEQCYGSACETVDVPASAASEALMVPANSPLIIEGSATSVRGHLCAASTDCSSQQDLETVGGYGLFETDAGSYILELTAEWDLEGSSVRASFAQEISLVTDDAEEPALAADVPDIAEVVCTEDGVRVDTPTVSVQPDGLHMHVTGDGLPAKVVDLYPSGRGSITLEFGEQSNGLDSRTALVAPPGLAEVSCRDAGEPRTRDGAAAIEILDPGAIWNHEAMSCPGDDVRNSGGFWFYDSVNAMASGIARSVPGILPSDEISYGAYPSMAFARWRVVRDGAVVATMDLSTYDERVFVVSLFSCLSSRIGEEGAPSSGKPATPFRLGAYDLCDPYASPCASVFLSAQWYMDNVGPLHGTYAVPPTPWMECDSRQREGCAPNLADAPLEVLLAPADASAFIDEMGCGSSPEAMCRDSRTL
jgi:hypothetical protein